MSESENLNFDSPSNEHPDDGLRALSDLLPQPLEINRDDLFFQAGFAAGIAQVGVKNSLSLWERAGSPQATRRAVSPPWRGEARVSGVFWPAVTAALLLVCAGLGAAVISDAISMNRIHQEIAEAKNAPTQTVAQSESQSSQQADDTRTNNDRLFTDRQQRSWLKLASTAPLPPGRLTAAGWEEMPEEMRSGEWGTGNDKSDAKQSSNPESSPHHPATYLELMRLQREG